MRFLVFVFFFLNICISSGQINFSEKYKTFVSTALVNQHDITPPLTLIEENNKPYRFAKSIPVSISFESNQSLIYTENDWRWAVQIKSKNALSLSLIFKRWWIPDNTEVYIYCQQDRLGPFMSNSSNKPSKKFSTGPCRGDEIYLEYISPHSVQSLPDIQIDKVVYGYKPLFFLDQETESFPSENQYVFNRKKTAGKCNVDLVCDKAGRAWIKEARSVVVLLTDENQMYCTGVLLNNAARDGRQLLLTAYHCIGSNHSGSTDIVMFNHQKKKCAGSRVSNTDTLHGLKYLTGSPLSDFALFEILERIPKAYNVYLSGWSTHNQPEPPLVGIHHPNGDVKKISIYNDRLIPSCWKECSLMDHWKIPKWTRGTTEPGSSGSPLFDRNHLVVGQLHGGSASCWNKNGYDLYGSFYQSWNSGLSDYLDPGQQLTQTNTTVFHLAGVYLNALER